ncbi:Uncharacterised protein [Mycobacterium tuberculosis]|nr:Uncharacterised protein [Mycobacterium tuberculosis]
MLSPVVFSHCSPQFDRSRPEAFSNAASRSSKLALPKACVRK